MAKLLPIAIAAALLATSAAAVADDHDDRIRELERQLEESTRKLAEAEQEFVYAPLRVFRHESHGHCTSPYLAAALRGAWIFDQAAEREGIFEAHQNAARLYLDVAETAAERGCPNVARQVFRLVIRRYIGAGYAAHRQRAEIGLSDLR